MTAPETKKETKRQGAGSHLEIELKLRSDAEGMAVLLGSAHLAGPGREGKHLHIHAIYYDTPELTLHDRGVSFRIRKEDGRYIQTVKSVGTRAGAMCREERRVEVPDLAPRPDWFDGVGAVAELDKVAADELEPVFTTKFERQATLVNYVGSNGRTSLIEIACDRGAITSQNGERDIYEIELELLQGDATALYDLALELHDIYPLHVETRSKSERGYDLVSGRRPVWHRSSKHPLSPDVTIDQAIGEIFRARYADWLANEEAAIDGRDPEGVHQMRVALRRLRSALVVFRRFLPDEQHAWLKTESKWLADCLGPARDLDVFSSEILEPVCALRPDDRGLLALRHRTNEARAVAYDELRHAIASPRYGRFALEFGRWLEGGVWRRKETKRMSARLDAPLQRRAAKLLTRQYRKVMELGECVKDGTDEERHELRIAIKKLRYSADFMPAAYAPKEVRQFRKDLSRLQDDLGLMNDLAVTEARLNRLTADRQDGVPSDVLVMASGQILGWCTRIGQQHEADLWDAWQGFTSRTPFWLDDGEKSAFATGAAERKK